ncbi:GDSL-type esterase/lipase family protein [Nocardia sp. CDC153]|uniref:GDSL-type esterase/lipase family protein n=1 Tax=Nocardia sp. CDC153 TaxID=3112167 RepID=UPI002DBF6936|nr:GDSL-type esterase/lipase family protein [Nocardia sp. CDC153]MEC3958152.1 GDSL-type esterase/lipase family protein [Nocardia sp. CDC153]
MVLDLRVCFVGESFVAGVGDQKCLGWAGRLAVRAIAAGQPLTYYNLGVRRENSTELAARWEAECAPRLPQGADCRVVISTGVNDTQFEDGRPRVEVEDSVRNLADMLRRVREKGWQAMVVAPPPNVDAEHNARIVDLDARFADLCEEAKVPYLRTHQPLRENQIWMQDVAAGDGYHPGAAGYDEFAALLAPHWLLWLADPGSELPVVR